ncbi:hypothetical protein JMJ77_0008605 [Colletotrichum scovillei]|uniref:Uncharacterized protein n=1 Tax=Colletotrichum scovillei TaxID=1209932 RepID=A0A9P7ULQ1_9PEZI|nr:hypothetical protein JMJ77_0008605 [Colletotrichum scovillei]KAG7075597.1 hypothetical protein JMJ76_0012056 [Colletotrichum scovillei]KAG7082710.1 hypothetical protein JMJ78_0004810 [Colletotrichum scovillei]
MFSVVRFPAHAPLIFKQRLDPTVLSVTAEVTITLFSSGRMNPLIAPGAECFTCTISNWADQLVVTGNIEKETSRAGQQMPGAGQESSEIQPPRQEAKAELSSAERQCQSITRY